MVRQHVNEIHTLRVDLMIGMNNNASIELRDLQIRRFDNGAGFCFERTQNRQLLRDWKSTANSLGFSRSAANPFR
jgi:hypothetical protein